MHLISLASNWFKTPTGTAHMSPHQEHYHLIPSTMARTWFAGPPGTRMVPPSKAAPSITGDPAQSSKGVLSASKIIVNDFTTSHQTTPTEAVHADSEPGGSVTLATPSLSPQEELNTHPTKVAIEASANLAKLIQQHSKPKEPQMAATSKFKRPTTSTAVETRDAFAPSSSTPRRAPIAQMVPLIPNAAVTTTSAATATPKTTTTSIFGPCHSQTNTSNSPLFFPVIAPTSLSLSSSSILPSSPTTSQKICPKRKSTPKIPHITLTPAPASAPSAFKDATRVVHVPNTKLLSIAKQQQTKGVKKRQYIRTPSSLRPALTADSSLEETRARGRARTRTEEQPLQSNKQPRPPVQTRMPCPRTAFPNQSNSSLPALSVLPSQQHQAVTRRSNGDSNPNFCSEEPRLWPRRGNYVASLLRFNSKPESIHSEPVQACDNHAAHQDSPNSHGHGVCTFCHYRARRHIKATRPELLGSTWWPLCKDCGDKELRHSESRKHGCSCCSNWLCFSCQTEEIERRHIKNSVEAELRRRKFIEAGIDGDVETVMTGWACECGREVGPDAEFIKCIGCKGMRVGTLDPQEVAAREKGLRKTTLAWT